MRRRLALQLIGTIEAPLSRASAMMPSLARIAGPRGPSGAMPAHWPLAMALTISRKAPLPPLREEPSILSIPKWAIARALRSPSRCSDVRMFMGALRGQIRGIIIKRPCQKARMKGAPRSQNAAGCSPPRVVQLPKR